MITDAELKESFRRRHADRPSLHTADPPPPPVPRVHDPYPRPRMEVLDALTPEEDAAVQVVQAVDGAQASRAIAMRMLGFSTGEIADELRVLPRQVQRWFHQARSRGRLSDVGDRLKHHVAALAADRLELMVETGDREAVFEVLKGTGYLKTISATAGDARGDGAINLQVNVELPIGVRSVEDIPISGQIAGAPREITDGKEADDSEG
jgi:hypothetical protein